MEKNYSQTLKEVSCILKNMPNEDLEKLPKKLIEIIEKNKDEEYEFKINETLPIEKQNIKRETMAYMVMLYYNYWCQTVEEKLLLEKKLNSNEKAYEEIIKEKYSYDKMFKKNNNIENGEEIIKENQTQTKDIIKVEDKWYKKIFNKILKIFRRKI